MVALVGLGSVIVVTFPCHSHLVLVCFPHQCVLLLKLVYFIDKAGTLGRESECFR